MVGGGTKGPETEADKSSLTGRESLLLRPRHENTVLETLMERESWNRTGRGWARLGRAGRKGDYFATSKSVLETGGIHGRMRVVASLEGS